MKRPTSILLATVLIFCTVTYDLNTSVLWLLGCSFAWIVILRGRPLLDHWFEQGLRFVHEEDGQDVVEYALLTATIGLVGVVAWQGVGVGIFNAYTGWDAGVQDLGACTPDPIAFGGGCAGGS